MAAEPQPRSTHPDEALGAASLGGFSSSCRVGSALQVVTGRGETRNAARLPTLTFHNPTYGAMEQEGCERGHRKRQRCGRGGGRGWAGSAEPGSGRTRSCRAPAGVDQAGQGWWPAGPWASCSSCTWPQVSSRLLTPLAKPGRPRVGGREGGVWSRSSEEPT